MYLRKKKKWKKIAHWHYFICLCWEFNEYGRHSKTHNCRSKKVFIKYFPTLLSSFLLFDKYFEGIDNSESHTSDWRFRYSYSTDVRFIRINTNMQRAIRYVYRLRSHFSISIHSPLMPWGGTPPNRRGNGRINTNRR